MSPSALIFAPQGRDAAVAASLLAAAGLAPTICRDWSGFVELITEEAHFAVATEEAVRDVDLKPLAAVLKAQPAWSDFPFIFLTHRGGSAEQNPAAQRFLELFGNVTFLERPFHPTTFVSLARAAVRGRNRQYEARSRIEEVREAEKRLQTALVAGRLGSWELDIATRNLAVTPTCKAVFGRQPEESFTYQDLLDSIHPEDRPQLQDAVSRADDAGADHAIEYRVVWPDRSTHWAEIRARVVGGAGGQLKRMVGVCSDITERKTAEDRLKKLNETLEVRVAARTAELERAHATVLDEIAQRGRAVALLRQAQKMEMIGQLTGGVAHDFNNLLMAVIGNLELLRKHLPGDARTYRFLDGAMQGAQRGAALTQRLLAFARQQDLDVRPTDIGDLIRGMVDLLKRSIASNISLSLDLPDTRSHVLIDANQVELALLNLVVNARDAMPDGGSVSISVKTIALQDDSTLKPGRYVRLAVADTGLGMSPEVLERATEPFFSTKEVGKGTGLGLSMIQGLAVQLGGALVLRSQQGKGTVAELWLPATELETSVVPGLPDVPTQSASLERLRILAVDDDVLILMSTVDMLEDLGHHVVSAHSGSQALDLLRSDEPIDLVVTDFSMPKMTGAELALQARKLRPDLPVLLATGYAELPPGNKIDIPRLSKPFFQADLASAIEKTLNRSS